MHMAQPFSCTGGHEHNGDCMLAHVHATITETNCPSTGWAFLATANQPIRVAVGVHVKHKAGVTHRTWMGDGGKPTAMQMNESGKQLHGIDAEFTERCLGERENPMSCKVREGLEETGSLIRPCRWSLSWLRTGTIGKVWQLMEFSTFLTASDTRIYKEQPFSRWQEFESSMWATYEDIIQIEAESHPDFDFGVDVDKRQYPREKVHLLSKRVELGARAAGVAWPGSLARIELPKVQPVEPEPIPTQKKQLQPDERSAKSKEGKAAKARRIAREQADGHDNEQGQNPGHRKKQRSGSATSPR